MDHPIATNAVEIPYEVIQNIMDCLVFPRLILPFTFRPLIFSSGHPQYKLKPMIHVCKSWYYAILPLLYRDVVVTKSSQLADLVKRIQEPNSSFHEFIKSIEIRCVPPIELGSIEFRCGIETLLQTCPNITKFAYTRYYTPLRTPMVYPQLTGHITHLHLQWTSTIEELEVALRHTSASLLSLFVSWTDDTWPPGPLRSTSPMSEISFPRLHTLCIPQDSRVFMLLMNWDMPKLTNLLLWLECIHYDYVPCRLERAKRPYLVDTTYDYSNKFFKKFGSNIKVLDIHRNDDKSIEHILSPSVLMSHCPALEHIILHHHQNAGTLGPSVHEPFSLQQFKHPNVKWIDIWAEESVEDTIKYLESLKCFPLANKSDSDNGEPACEDLPNAQGFRIFPKHLFSWSHLPLLIPPSFAPVPEVVEFSPAREVDIVGWLNSVHYDTESDDEDYEPEDSDEDESESDEPEDSDEDDDDL